MPAGAGGTRPVLQLVSPFGGTAVALEELQDPVYAQAVIGRGVAVLPDEGDDPVRVLAPCTAVVHALQPHAVMLLAENGRAVLVHLGTRGREPARLEARVRPGDRVVPGDALLLWEPPPGRDRELASPLVALQAAAGSVVALVAPGESVRAGQPLLLWS